MAEGLKRAREEHDRQKKEDEKKRKAEDELRRRSEGEASSASGRRVYIEGENSNPPALTPRQQVQIQAVAPSLKQHGDPSRQVENQQRDIEEQKRKREEQINTARSQQAAIDSHKRKQNDQEEQLRKQQQELSRQKKGIEDLRELARKAEERDRGASSSAAGMDQAVAERFVALEDRVDHHDAQVEDLQIKQDVMGQELNRTKKEIKAMQRQNTVIIKPRLHGDHPQFLVEEWGKTGKKPYADVVTFNTTMVKKAEELGNKYEKTHKKEVKQFRKGMKTIFEDGGKGAKSVAMANAKSKKSDTPPIWKVITTETSEGDAMKRFLLKGVAYWAGDDLIVKQDEPGEWKKDDDFYKVREMGFSCTSKDLEEARTKKLEDQEAFAYKRQAERCDHQWEDREKAQSMFRPVFGKGKGKDDDMMCHNCGQVGHMVKDCPNPERYRTCGGTDHKASECPKTKCYKCNQYGHQSYNCTQKGNAKGKPKGQGKGKGKGKGSASSKPQGWWN